MRVFKIMCQTFGLVNATKVRGGKDGVHDDNQNENRSAVTATQENHLFSHYGGREKLQRGGA